MGYPACSVFTRALQALQEYIQTSCFSQYWKEPWIELGMRTQKLAAQVQSTRDCVKVHVGHRSKKRMVRRDFRNLRGVLPYLIKKLERLFPFQTSIWSCSQRLSIMGINSIFKRSVPVLHFPEWRGKKKKLFLRSNTNISAAISGQCFMPYIFTF